MTAFIIEDERLAIRRLTDLLSRHSPPITVAATADSVESAVQLLQDAAPPDVLFLDIHLSDGLSFEIFEQLEVRCPIIFTTAYDAYALRAFKVNSIDYLLKPIDEDELNAALAKLRALRGSPAPTPPQFDSAQMLQLLRQLQPASPQYRQQFVVKVGEHLKVIPVESIRYFFSLDSATFLQTQENRRYVIDQTLEQLEKLLDPRRFFRLNRAYFVQQNAIQDIIHYTNSRLKTVLSPAGPDGDVLVSRERVAAFRAWLER